MSSPNAGYYPDPSIPGYIRYWNGSGWVPGTSRPAPAQGEEVTPPPSAGPVAPSVASPPAPRTPEMEESGPMFLDEDPSAPVASPGEQEPDPAPAEPARPVFPEARGSANASANAGMGAGAGAASAPQAARAPAQQQGRPASAPPAQAAPAAFAQGGGAPAQAPAQPGGANVPWQRQVHDLAQPEAQGRPQFPQQAQYQEAQYAEPQYQEAQHQQPQLQPQPQQDEQPLPWKPVAHDPFASATSSARPAGLGQRLAARLIDGLIVGAVVAAAAVPLGTAAYDHIQAKIDAARLTGETVTVWLIDGTTSVQLGIVVAVLLVVGVLYEAVPTGKWGRTLGKKLFKLKVLDIDSQYEPGFGTSLRRYLIQTLLNVMLVGVVGVAWCLFDRPWRQGWHDKLARTFVAKDA